MTKLRECEVAGTPVLRQTPLVRGRGPPRLTEVKAVGQERIAQLLNSSPAVIYSFKA